jgi:hypothetical protein
MEAWQFSMSPPVDPVQKTHFDHLDQRYAEMNVRGVAQHQREGVKQTNGNDGIDPRLPLIPLLVPKSFRQKDLPAKAFQPRLAGWWCIAGHWSRLSDL